MSANHRETDVQAKERAATESRLRLTNLASRSRAHATELLLSADAATKNAEALEKIVCHGTDAEVSQTIDLLGPLLVERPS